MIDTDGISSLESEKIGYIEKGTGEHESNRVYSSKGLARALQARDWKGSMIVSEERNTESAGDVGYKGMG